MKNRVAPQVEETVVEMTLESPAYEQVRVSNELRKRGISVSGGGVRSIWQRHGLETAKKRLKAMEGRCRKTLTVGGMYNQRTDQGKRCQGRTPMETFIDGLELVKKKDLTKEFNG